MALAKIVAAAGPSLAAVPKLSTHLLQRYLGLSVQLQRHRLRLPPTASAAMGPADFGHGGNPWQGGPQGEALAGGGVGDARRLSAENQRRLSGGSSGGEAAAAAAPPPPLHAGSLRLFLGSLCQMLGEAPVFMKPEVAAAGGRVVLEQASGAMGEAEEVLRALVEGELRCLGGVLDRRRQLGENERRRARRCFGALGLRSCRAAGWGKACCVCFPFEAY